MTLPGWPLAGLEDVPTPCLAVRPDLVKRNLAEAVRIAGGPARLRPHAKTHKCPEVVALELAAGVVRHKAATIAEAEMLAAAGAADVLLAYPLVGPNPARFVHLCDLFPRTRFRAVVEHPEPLRALHAAAGGRTLSVLVDLDVGMGRTGATLEQLPALAAALRECPGLRLDGLHVYDGHVHDPDPAVRARQVDESWRQALDAEAVLGRAGLIVAGGTGSFPRWAERAAADARIECSPGTVFLHDFGYGRRYADLAFTPAALALTRVVSVRGGGVLTLDLGTKAVATDNPAPERVFLPGLPGAEILGHNEEHLIVRHPEAGRFRHGDVLPALPKHICPTVALHRELLVLDAAGRPQGTWRVAARDRVLTA